MIEIILDRINSKQDYSSFPQNTKEMKNNFPLVNLVTKETSQKNHSFKLSNADSYIVMLIIIYPPLPLSLDPHASCPINLPRNNYTSIISPRRLRNVTSVRDKGTRKGFPSRVRRGNDKRSVEACAHGLTHVSMKKEDCRHGTRNPSRSLVHRYFRLISRVVNQPRRETNLTSRESDLR